MEVEGMTTMLQVMCIVLVAAWILYLFSDDDKPV